MVRINGDTSGLEKALGKAEKSGSGLGAAFKKAEGSSFALLGGLTAAGIGAAVFGAKSMEAYNASVEASQKLRTNLLNVKGATEEHVKSLQNQAAQLQKIGVIEDDAIIAGQSQLATFNLQGSTIEKLTPKIADMVAQLKGHNATAEDMVTINNLVGKVMTGNIGALSRYGVTLSETQKEQLKNGDETQRANILNEVLAQNYGKVNEALRKTPQGQLTAFKNTFGDFMELAGEFTSNLVGPLIGAFNGWFESMGGPEGVMKALKETMESIAPWLPVIAGAIIGGLIPAFVALGVSIWTALAPLLPFIAAGAALGFGVKLLIDHFGGLDQVMKKLQPAIQVMSDLWSTYLQPALMEVWKVFQERLLPALKQLWDQISPILIPVLKTLGIILGAVVFAQIMIFVEGLRLAIGWISNIINWVSNAIGWLKNFIGAVGNIAGQIGGALAGVYNAITTPFSKAFDFITGIPGKIVGAVGNIGQLLRDKLGDWDIPGPLGKVRDVIPGFAEGGFTGRGGVNEIAGIVHKGEYVLPQSEVDQMSGRPKLFSNDERINTGGGLSGGPSTVIEFNPTFQVGMFAGMPTEYRELAERMWVEFQRIAQSNGIKLQTIGARSQ
ncbi:MAG: hypothetical protein WC747_04315 [Candidatus Babeliales bacterium]|jgi:hypothetical protein